MNLCEDYTELVKRWMINSGIQSDKSNEKLWYEFFNLQKKAIIPKKRKVWFSKEFICPPDLKNGLKIFVEKFQNGDNVSPHLSKAIQEPSKFDELLYDWVIYHFHLGDVIDSKTGRIRRTKSILFAKVDYENVYCINVYPHGSNVQQPWSKQEMIKIIHCNWPKAIEKWKLPVGTELYPESIFPATDEQYALLRKSGITTAIFVDKGVAYFSPGGGYMASGHSQEIISLCDKIHKELKLTEIYINDNLTSIVEKIESFTQRNVDYELRFKLVEKNGRFYVIDLQSKVELILINL